MSDKGEANLSAAFDALLEKNWQRLDALSVGGSRAARATPRPAPRAAADSSAVHAEPGSRRNGRCDGLNFSFET